MDELNDEQIANMSTEEILAFSLQAAGNIRDFEDNAILTAAMDIVRDIGQIYALNTVLGEDATPLLAEAMASAVASTVGAVVDLARAIERFAQANPDFPGADGSPSESV